MSEAKTESGIPFKVEGETTYLSPDSAEGKALQRIDSFDPDDPTQWITVVEEGQEIDVDGALNRLRQRGYKV